MPEQDRHAALHRGCQERACDRLAERQQIFLSAPGHQRPCFRAGQPTGREQLFVGDAHREVRPRQEALPPGPQPGGGEGRAGEVAALRARPGRVRVVVVGVARDELPTQDTELLHACGDVPSGLDPAPGNSLIEQVGLLVRDRPHVRQPVLDAVGDAGRRGDVIGGDPHLPAGVRGRAAGLIRGLQHDHRGAGLGGRDSRRKAAQARADHDHIRVPRVHGDLRFAGPRAARPARGGANGRSNSATSSASSTSTACTSAGTPNSRAIALAGARAAAAATSRSPAGMSARYTTFRLPSLKWTVATSGKAMSATK